MFEYLSPIIAQANGEGAQGFLPTILMMAGIFVIFYFLLIRPQQKRQKELKKQIEGLGKGDKFITAGGIYAVVVGIKDTIVTAKISPDVKVEISKSAIATVVQKASGE